MISAFVMPEQVELFHGKLTLSIRSPLFFFWLLANDFTYNTDWLFVKFLIYIYCYQHHGFAFSLCIQLSFIEHHQHKPLVRIILLCSNIFAEHLLRVNLLVRTKTANCSMCNHSVFESIRLTCAVMLEECQILFGTNMCCFYHSCSAAAKYLFFPDLRMLLVFLSS